jgi:hypothetical protein
MFDAAAIAPPRQGSRNDPGANSHPQTKRSYLLRSFVFCELCGRRMFGKTKKGHAYYSCQPGLNLGSAADRCCPDHPSTVWVREDAVLAGIAQFFSQRIFGARRAELLEDDLGDVDRHTQRTWETKRKSRQRAIEEIEQRQARLIQTLETHDDPDGTVSARVRSRLGELEQERRVKLDELAGLERSRPNTDGQDPHLLDELPVLDVDFSAVPESILRPFFDAFRLEARYDKHQHHITVRVTITGDTVNTILPAVTSVAVKKHAAERPRPARRSVTHVVVAPGRIRTTWVTPGQADPGRIITVAAIVPLRERGPMPGGRSVGSNPGE